MTTYVVLEGDTFNRVSRNVYAVETKSNLIRRANPGVVEPLSQGTTLNIPVDVSAPVDQAQQLVSNDPAQVTISIRIPETINKSPELGSFFDETVIRNKQFTIWESINIKRSIDSLSTISLRAPFDPDDKDMRTLFKPFTFYEITVSVGGNKLFVGTMVNPVPRLNDTKSTVDIIAYSLPGIMNDCNPPVGDYPLSWEQFTLKEIADDLAASFGVSVRFDDNNSLVFDNISMKPEAKALSFLQDLAKQRNLVIGDNRDGELVFRQSVEIGSPVARLQQGFSPLISVTPKFNAQKTFSSVTGISTSDVGTDGEPVTVQTGILGGRYHTYIVKDTVTTSLKEVVEAKVGRMYGNMATYECKVSTWFDPFGSLWTPNTTVKLLAPGAMVYEEYEFIIRSVEYSRTSESETAVLHLVLPGSFSGQIPASLPWE